MIEFKIRFEDTLKKNDKKGQGARLMRKTLLFFLISIFICQSLSMNCSDVPTETKCVQINGCSWNISCTGTFNPVCMPPNCYYVDSHPTTSTTEAGTPANPMKSISSALNKLANSTGTILIMNYIDNVTAEVNQTHVLSGGTTTIK